VESSTLKECGKEKARRAQKQEKKGKLPPFFAFSFLFYDFFFLCFFFSWKRGSWQLWVSSFFLFFRSKVTTTKKIKNATTISLLLLPIFFFFQLETKKVTITSLLVLPFFPIDVVTHKVTTDVQVFCCKEGDSNKPSPSFFFTFFLFLFLWSFCYEELLIVHQNLQSTMIWWFFQMFRVIMAKGRKL